MILRRPTVKATTAVRFASGKRLWITTSHGSVPVARRTGFPPGQRRLGALTVDNRGSLGHFGLRRHYGTTTDGELTASDDGPIYEYDRRVRDGLLRNDPHQRSIIHHLQRLHNDLLTYRAPPVQPPQRASPSSSSSGPSLFASLFRSRKQASVGGIPEALPRGLYLYGDVGSGKTMLMDLFYDTLPPAVVSKLRIHFDKFMQDVHKRLHQMKQEYGADVDAVPYVAADIAQRGNVLCFDEFQCTDVADAMILRRLLEALLSHGVVLVTTSNRHPDELYKNGIQRESFVPAIELLKDRLEVISLDSPTDYRKIPRPKSDVYWTQPGPDAQAHAEKWFRFLGDANDPEGHAESRTVWGREIAVRRVSGRCAWFTFRELIGEARSAADYLELMHHYDRFVVTDVPTMTHRQRDLARRFITFIDAVYERGAVLVLTTERPLTELFLDPGEVDDGVAAEAKKEIAEADAAPESGSGLSPMMDEVDQNIELMRAKPHLFSNNEEVFAFARALSRLTEMGSQHWVDRVRTRG